MAYSLVSCRFVFRRRGCLLYRYGKMFTTDPKTPSLTIMLWGKLGESYILPGESPSDPSKIVAILGISFYL